VEESGKGEGDEARLCSEEREREAREKVSKSGSRAFPEIEQPQAYRIAPKPYSEPRQMRFQMLSSVATR